MPLPVDVGRALTDYLQHRRRVGECRHVFVHARAPYGPLGAVLRVWQYERGGIDTTVIALRLGRESTQTTQIYIHADLSLKENALARTGPTNAPPGATDLPDQLLAFLEAL